MINISIWKCCEINNYVFYHTCFDFLRAGVNGHKGNSSVMHVTFLRVFLYSIRLTAHHRHIFLYNLVSNSSIDGHTSKTISKLPISATFVSWNARMFSLCTLQVLTWGFWYSKRSRWSCSAELFIEKRTRYI